MLYIKGEVQFSHIFPELRLSSVNVLSIYLSPSLCVPAAEPSEEPNKYFPYLTTAERERERERGGGRETGFALTSGLNMMRGINEIDGCLFGER